MNAVSPTLVDQWISYLIAKDELERDSGSTDPAKLAERAARQYG